MYTIKSLTPTLNIKIGYAEDQSWYRESMVAFLEENGFEITIVARDGKELVEIAKSNYKQPDIYLTDLDMPRMNGIQTTAAIIERWPHAKVAILSSKVERYYIDLAKKAGAIVFLHKILNYKELFQP